MSHTFTRLLRLFLILGACQALASSLAAELAASECRWVEVLESNGFDGPVTDVAQSPFEGPSDEFYVAGDFLGLHGAAYDQLVRYDYFSSSWDSVRAWQADEAEGKEIHAIHLTERNVFVAGDFSTLGSLEVNHIASLAAFGGGAALEGPSGIGLANSEGPVEIADLADGEDQNEWSLYVAGRFDSAGGLPVDGIARWDGSAWAALPDPEPSVPASYTSLLWWDDGQGPALYAGSESGPVRRWDGRGWTDLAFPGPHGRRTADLAVWDDGGGAELYAAGWWYPASAGGEPRGFVSRWNGRRWIDFASGAEMDGTWIRSLAAIGSGGAAGLYAGGSFGAIDGVESNHVARWDGRRWWSLSGERATGVLGEVLTLSRWNQRFSDPVLVVGGDFEYAGGRFAGNLALWDGADWSAVPWIGSGAGDIETIGEWDDGTGTSLFVAGDFEVLDGEPISRLAHWDGTRWQPMPDSEGLFRMLGKIRDFASWDDGTGDALYVAGSFWQGLPESEVARWDGRSWSFLPGLVQPRLGFGGGLHTGSLQVWDDGSGPALFVGGRLNFGAEDHSLAKWDGSEWTPLASPTVSGLHAADIVLFDDGGGAELYFAQGTVRRWDGERIDMLPTIDAVGESLNLYHLAALESPEGSTLYAAGKRDVVRWDGTAWIRMEDGLRPGVSRRIGDLTVWDDGTESGPALYLGGTSLVERGSTLARWDRGEWRDLTFPNERGTGRVEVLYAGETGRAPALLQGGSRGGLHLAARTCRSPCLDDSESSLCVGGGDRFVVDVEWKDFRGERGSGRVVPFQTRDSGLFYFFGEDNWEMLVKVLDGCSLNGHFWVFSAATTTVEYTLTVTDTVTGVTTSYFNELGSAAPSVIDTTALPTCDVGRELSNAFALRAMEADRRKRPWRPPVPKGACVPSDTSMCLLEGRFQVEIDWLDFQGSEGPGRVVEGVPADGSGLFQFFGENNWEVLVKVLDGCALTDSYWVFAAATTNVGYTLRVTDTETGETATYSNPLGTAASAITDTGAFASCE